MPIFLLISAAIITLYVFFVLLSAYGWMKVSSKKNKLNNSNEKTVSVLVAFRNEEESIKSFLISICNQNYPKELLEIILVDDHSEDKSTQIVSSFIEKQKHIRLYSLENAQGKKAAIALAAQNAKGEVFVLTDADCEYHEDWIATYVSFMSENPEVPAYGPIAIMKSQSILNCFLQLENNAVAALTGAISYMGFPLMSGAANMAIPKALYDSAKNAIKGNERATGDDVFLLEALFLKNNKKAVFLSNRELIVRTKAASSINELLEQKKRWLSKTSAYSLALLKWIGLIILSGNLIVFPICFVAFITPIVELKKALFLLLIMKFVFDFLLLFLTSSYFKNKICLIWYPIFALVYPLYAIWVAVTSQISKYRWKGRVYQK